MFWLVVGIKQEKQQKTDELLREAAETKRVADIKAETAAADAVAAVRVAEGKDAVVANAQRDLAKLQEELKTAGRAASIVSSVSQGVAVVASFFGPIGLIVSGVATAVSKIAAEHARRDVERIQLQIDESLKVLASAEAAAVEAKTACGQAAATRDATRSEAAVADTRLIAAEKACVSASELVAA